MCCNCQGEHTPLGSWSGDCRGAPMQPSGRSRGLLRTLSWSQGLILPRPGPGRRALAALLRVLMSAVQFIAAQPFFLPWNRLPCFPAASHRVGGWGASCQAGFGSLGLWVCGVCSCGCVCTYVYITEVSVRNALGDPPRLLPPPPPPFLCSWRGKGGVNPGREPVAAPLREGRRWEGDGGYR